MRLLICCLLFSYFDVDSSVCYMCNRNFSPFSTEKWCMGHSIITSLLMKLVVRMKNTYCVHVWINSVVYYFLMSRISSMLSGQKRNCKVKKLMWVRIIVLSHVLGHRLISGVAIFIQPFVSGSPLLLMLGISSLVCAVFNIHKNVINRLSFFSAMFP